MIIEQYEESLTTLWEGDSCYSHLPARLTLANFLGHLEICEATSQPRTVERHPL